MERKGCGSGYAMRMQVSGLQAENGITVTTEAGGATTAADVRRRRKLAMMKKNASLFKKKRTSDSVAAVVAPPPPANFTDLGRLQFLFSKKLQNSDVNQVGRMVLPKIAAETCLPRLLNDQKLILRMNDMDNGDEWSFKFRYWPNNKSRMYVLEGTGEFAEKHSLEAGDSITLYEDLVNHNYVIRAVKSSKDEKRGNKEATNVNGNKKDVDLINKSLDMPLYVGSALEFEALNMPINFPNMEGPSLKNDNIYFSDILDSFGTWEEFMTINYPPIQKSTSFENLSDEDLSQL